MFIVLVVVGVEAAQQRAQLSEQALHSPCLQLVQLQLDFVHLSGLVPRRHVVYQLFHTVADSTDFFLLFRPLDFTRRW